MAIAQPPVLEGPSISFLADPARHAPTANPTWRTGLLIFALLLGAYLMNGRPHESVDTKAAPYTAWSLLRHGSLDLRPYPDLERLIPNHVRELPDGRWVTIRSLGSALVAVPFLAPVALFRDQPLDPVTMGHVGKLASATLVAAAGVIFFFLCRRLAPSAAWPATILFGLGTMLWTTAGQALWMHGPAVFWLTLALYWLLAGAIASPCPSAVPFPSPSSSF